jgi:hypothetical protein
MRINTNLESEFNLEPINPMASEELEIPEVIEQYDGQAILSNIDKISAALPLVQGLDSSDKELDELADYAIEAHKNLMDVAMNVEQRFVGEISGAAGNMLGHAITARTNKLKKKLDMINLQIKKQVADARTKSLQKDSGTDSEPLAGEATVFDRNQLLADILAMPKPTKDAKTS